MIGRLALTTLFLLFGAMPAPSQTHTPPHPIPHPHGPGHMRPDSVTHAAMHARLHGNWAGTLSSHRGVRTGFDMLVTRDSLRKILVTTKTERPSQAGIASDFVMNGDKLEWTQNLSGRSCKATAVLSAVTPRAPETIRGEMACEDGELAFTLRKMTG